MNARIPEYSRNMTATMAAAPGSTIAGAAKAASKQAVNNPPAVARPQPEKSSTVVTLGQSRQAPALGLYDKKGAVANAAPVGKAASVTSAPVTQNAGGFVADGGRVTVEIKASDSGFENKIYWSTDNFATKNYLGIDNQTGSFDLGKIAKGTRIDFGIDNGQGGFFRTGGAAANSDNIDHTTQRLSKEGVQIGFEDLAGGGDRDYNDAIIQVRSTLVASEQKAPNTMANGNRSGLGDGTNPGQGAGTVRSGNQGTLNPNAVGSVAPPPVQTARPVKKATTPVAAPWIVQQVAGDNLAQAKGIKGMKGVAPPSVNAAIAKTLGASGSSNTKADVQKLVQSVAERNTANATATTGSNRSGLADGTNPGQGAGRANASNQGTNNPSQAPGANRLHVVV